MPLSTHLHFCHTQNWRSRLCMQLVRWLSTAAYGHHQSTHYPIGGRSPNHQGSERNHGGLLMLVFVCCFRVTSSPPWSGSRRQSPSRCQDQWWPHTEVSRCCCCACAVADICSWWRLLCTCAAVEIVVSTFTGSSIARMSSALSRGCRRKACTALHVTTSAVLTRLTPSAVFCVLCCAVLQVMTQHLAAQ
jgi:hypothetical protein